MRLYQKLFLSSSVVLALSPFALAQQSQLDIVYPTTIKCERSFSKDTPAAVKKKVQARGFSCDFEFVELKNNISPISTSMFYRQYLPILVAPNTLSASSIHELSIDFKLVKVNTEISSPDNSFYCEEQKGSLTEYRNDQLIPKWKSGDPFIISPRTWTYKSILKCVIPKKNT